LLLTIILAQTPFIREGGPESHAGLAWSDAIQFLHDPGMANEVIGFFREAAENYEIVCRRDGATPYCLRWLGYSYHAAGDLPHAINAYRRGLHLDLADAKLHTALAYARAQVQYPPAPDLARLMQPERDYWPGWLSLRHLGVYAFGLYFVACLTATRWRMTRRCRWLLAAAGALALAAVPAVGSAVLWQRERRDAATPVVVVARDCPLRVGNGPNYPPRLDAPLPRGAEVRRLHERAGWLQVELASGIVGWLPRDAVVRDSPDPHGL
jgi:hypothetical protein